MEDLRVLLAKRKMSITNLQEDCRLARETIYHAMDGDYSKSTVKSLMKIAEAMPGVELVIGFQEKEDNQ